MRKLTRLLLSLLLVYVIFAGIAGTISASSEVITFPILSGTSSETDVYIIQAENPGPTIMVTGGVHGDELSGIKAARIIKDWNIDNGTLIVIPETNKTAVDAWSRNGADGLDLNRQFPEGQENQPTSEVARAVWEVVTTYEPDVIMDLHSSRGIYGITASSVGQTLVTHPAGDSLEFGDDAMAYMNAHHLSEEQRPDHDFQRIGMSKPMLAYKTGYDYDVPAFIVETSRPGNVDAVQVRWQLGFVDSVLTWYGIFDESRYIVPEGYNVQGNTMHVEGIQSSLQSGETIQASVTIDNDANQTADVTRFTDYRTSNRYAVTVSEQGLITAVGAGEATITINYGDQSETVQIVVIGEGDETSEEAPQTIRLETEFVINGANVQSLEAGQLLTVNVTATNEMENSQDALLIIALYDEANTLRNFSFISKNVMPGATETIGAGFKLPEDVEGHKVRSFVWDGNSFSNSNMMPLSNVAELTD